MTAPSPREGSPSGSFSGTSDATSFAVTLAPHDVGDTLFVFIASDGTGAVLSCTGWTQVGAANSTTSKGHLFRRDTVAASNAEANPTFISTASEQYGAIAYLVPGAGLLNLQYAVTSGSSGTPDAANLSITGGPLDCLLVVFYAFDGNVGMSAAPTGYSTPLIAKNSNSTGATAITAFRTATSISSENPDAASSTSEQFAVFTIAIYETPPAPAPARGGTMPMMGV